eukprot:3839238-Amphidinium_carterae.1
MRGAASLQGALAERGSAGSTTLRAPFRLVGIFSRLRHRSTAALCRRYRKRMVQRALRSLRLASLRLRECTALRSHPLAEHLQQLGGEAIIVDRRVDIYSVLCSQFTYQAGQLTHAQFAYGSCFLFAWVLDFGGRFWRSDFGQSLSNRSGSNPKREHAIRLIAYWYLFGLISWDGHAVQQALIDTVFGINSNNVVDVSSASWDLEKRADGAAGSSQPTDKKKQLKLSSEAGGQVHPL